MNKNKPSLCKECQARAVEYRVSPKSKHGMCRACFERCMARRPGAAHRHSYRSTEQREDLYETKHGG